MDLNQFRQQYPQYNDIDDETLANSLHEKFYSDIPKDEFLSKVMPMEETAGISEALVGGTKNFLSSIGTGLAAPFTSGEEASVAGIERQKKFTERSATSLENVKRAYNQKGLASATGEVISQAPAAIAEQSPILASIYGGFRLVKNVPGPVGAAARIITPMLPIFFSMAGSNMQRKAEEDIAQGKDVDINEVGAYATAFGQTAVERVGLALSGVSKLLGISINPKKVGTEVVERLAKQSLTKAIGKGAALFTAYEIPTEVSQQMMERYYAGLSLTDDDAMNEYAETAFAVSLMAPIGSFGSYKQRRDAKATIDPVDQDDDTKAIADPVDQDDEIKDNKVKAIEAKSEKEGIKDSEEDLKLKEQGEELLGASLDPAEMPVGPTEAETIAIEEQKVLDEEAADKEREIIETQTAAIEGQEVGPIIKEEENAQISGRNNDGPRNTRGGLDSSMDGKREDTSKIETSNGAAVVDPKSTLGGTTTTAGGVKPALTPFEKKEERRKNKLEKRRLKLVEQEVKDDNYNIDKPKIVDERTDIRINDFESPLDTNEDKQKISQEVKSLAEKLKTKVPQFLKTGAVFTSPLEESPFDKSKSTDEHIENTIEDYIFEEGYETKTTKPEGFEKGTTRGNDAQGNPIEVTAQDLREERATIRKEFYDSPILDNYLERIGETKESRIDKRVEAFNPPISAQQITSDEEIKYQRAKENAENEVLTNEQKADQEIEVEERKEILKQVKIREQEYKKQGRSPKDAKDEALADFGIYSKGKNINFASNSEAKRLLEESPNTELGIESISRLLDRMITIAENPKAPLLDPKTNRPLTVEKRREYERKLKFQRIMLTKLSEFPNMKDVKLNVASQKQMRNIELKELDVKGQLSSITGKNKSVILGQYIDARNGSKIGLKGNNIFILGNLTSEQTIGTFTHEVSHAATVYGMNFMTTDQALEFTRILDRAREVAKQQGVTKTEGDFYGLTNIQEFVAESLSNNNFSNFLRKTPSGKSNLLVRLINAISNLLGFDQVIPVSDTTLLDDIMVQNKKLFDFGIMPTDDAQLLADFEQRQSIKASNLLKEGRTPEIIAALFDSTEILARKGSKKSTSDSDELTNKEIEAKYKENYPDNKNKITRLGYALKSFFSGGKEYQRIVSAIQSRLVEITYAMKKREMEMRRANQLIIGEEGFNNFYEQSTLMHGRAQNYLKALMPIMREFEQSMIVYTELYKQKNPNKTDEDARAYAQRLLTAQHELERREVVHMMSVPLSIKKTIIYKNKNGKNVKISPAEMREKLMDIITNSKTRIDKATLDSYKKKILDLANPANNQVDGIGGVSYGGKNTSKTKTYEVNIEDSEYDVTSFSYNKATEIREELNELKNTDPQLYEALTNIQSNMNKIQRGQVKSEVAPDGIKGILELSQIANFSPIQAQNIINMYGWDYYIPLKGKNLNKFKDKDRMIETLYDDSGGALSTNIKKLPSSMEGTQKDSEDPFTQVIVDASQAAARAGRQEFTKSIMNAITILQEYTDAAGNPGKPRGVIEGKIEKVFTYKERLKNDAEIEEILNKKNTIPHFEKDGSLVILSIKDNDLLAGIRGLPRQENAFIDTAGGITSMIGQLHTRFNVKFAPLNFIRDAITNLYIVGTDLGFEDMVGYTYSIARQVKGNMFHTGRIVNFYINGKPQEAKKYADKLNKKGNTYGLTMIDYLEEGGMVSITASLSNQSEFQQQMSEIKGDKIARTGQQIRTIFDTYMGMFELATRVSVFMIYRDNYIAKKASGKTKKNVPENVLKAANQTASAYAKNLSNFEKAGTMGRNLGAWFMFFRASMTGAARASESIAPAFISLEKELESVDPTIKGNPEKLAEFSENYNKQRERASTTIGVLLGLGFTLYHLAALANEISDEENEENRTYNDDLSRWTRHARMPIGFLSGNKDEVVQIPWGFGLGGIAALGAQLAGLIDSNENTKASIIGNMINITLDSFAPFPVSKMDPTEKPRMWFIDTALPTALRPMFEAATNVNTFGSPITNLQTSKRYGSAYGSFGSTPAMFEDLAIYFTENDIYVNPLTKDTDWDPNMMYFLFNNYADGVASLAQSLYGLQLSARGKKDFELKHDTVVLGSFFSKYSKIEQRAFSRTSQDIQKLQSKISLFKGSNPIKYYETLSKYPNAEITIARYNSHKAKLNEVTQQIKAIQRNSSMNRKSKTDLIEPMKMYRLMIQRQMIHMVDQEVNDGLLD